MGQQSFRLRKKNIEKIMWRIENMPLVAIPVKQIPVVLMNKNTEEQKAFIPLPMDEGRVYAGNFTSADLELL